MEVATLLSPIGYSFPAMKHFWGSHLGVFESRGGADGETEGHLMPICSPCKPALCPAQ